MRQAPQQMLDVILYCVWLFIGHFAEAQTTPLEVDPNSWTGGGAALKRGGGCASGFW
jgi:hypothetical protein